MRRLTPDEVFTHSLHAASLRTAALIVVARHFGTLAEGQLLLTGAPSGSMDTNMVFGRARLNWQEMNEHQRKIASLAEAIANYIEDDPDATGMIVLDYLDTDGLEGLKAKMVGTYVADLDECIALLRKLWTSVRAEAESLERDFNGV